MTPATETPRQVLARRSTLAEQLTHLELEMTYERAVYATGIAHPAVTAFLAEPSPVAAPRSCALTRKR
ncbi:hypothetical protein [Microbacterium sp. zg-YB36]|uniref:hypothetical protein n=1 Tax=Microbacterium sp. zg-YB36 TaxID=2969407 RepID=UPI00214BBAD0|nr:hypothetical protein [Microbacterium sp. zg-YB36]MDL5352334.1 hypothetical protein [Microbacterium sp. zg-YB36]